MAAWPCQNPNCKSNGTPHPGCQCGAPGANGYAEGGEIGSACERGISHNKNCQYFAQGGAVEAPDFISDADFMTSDDPQADLIGSGMKKIGSKIAESPQFKQATDFGGNLKRYDDMVSAAVHGDKTAHRALIKHNAQVAAGTLLRAPMEMAPSAVESTAIGVGRPSELKGVGLEYVQDANGNVIGKLNNGNLMAEPVSGNTEPTLVSSMEFTPQELAAHEEYGKSVGGLSNASTAEKLNKVKDTMKSFTPEDLDYFEQSQLKNKGVYNVSTELPTRLLQEHVDKLRKTPVKMAEGGEIAPSPDFIPDSQFVPDSAPQLSSSVPNNTQATPDFIPDGEFQSDEDKYGTFGQQAITALEGAGEGASFGLSSGVERALGVDPMGIAMRREVNPGVHAAGEVAGLVGSSLIPGVGEANLLSKAGIGATKLIGLSAAESTAAKIAASAARGAVENALYQATSGEVGKLLAGDPSQSVGTAAAHIGLSGLLGAGAGAGISAASPLWKAAAETKLGSEMGNFISRMKERLNPPEYVTSEMLDAKPTLGSKLADKLIKYGTSENAGKAAGATVGGMAGHTLGLGGFGALIGEHTLAPFFTKALPMITKKLIEAGEASAEGIKAAAEYTGLVAKGEFSIDKAVKSVFKAGSEAAPGMASDKDRERLDKALQKLQVDPSSLSQVGGSTDVYFPGHGTAIGQTTANAVNYLNNLRPNIQGASPLDPKMPTTSASRSQFNKALDIAENPISVVDLIKRGTITPGDLQALNTLYPGLHQRISQKLMTGVIEAKTKGQTIPYSTRMSLSMFLGQPLDSTMTPSAILAAQSKQSSPKPQSDQPAPAKHSTSSLSKLPNSYQTMGQAAEMRRMRNH